MPKIIFTSRFIKGGAHSGSLVSYMATRDGVVLPQIVNGTRPATENQRKLIDTVIQELPDAAALFEYEDYVAAPTIENASAFISTAFEQNPELWSSVRNYVEYIARRPGAERSAVADHGLWNDGDEPIALSKAVREVAEHRGNIWTHVVSLRREDAERMGYTTADPWRNLVLEQLPTIANAMKIPIEQLRWYAAYHDKATNPHIHLLVYSADPTHGFLTEPGIEKMRFAFAHGIFKDEFMFIYERKDLVRGQLNEFAEQRLAELASSITGDSAEITELLAALGDELRRSRGKKQYGYLKPALKAQVDEIVRELVADPRIAEMYEHWCELTAEVKRVYTGTVDAAVPLEQEKTFRTIQNMIVRQALSAGEMVFEPAETVHEAPDDVADTAPADEPPPVNTAPPVVAPHQATGHQAHGAGNLLRNLAKLLQQDYEQQRQRYDVAVDHKLLSKIRRKKQEQGQKFE